MLIPTQDECIRILKQNNVPENIIAHCKKVCEVALKIADILEKKEIKVNRDLVIAASLLHDIEKLKEDHVNAGADLIKSMGFNEVANVMRKHGLEHLEEENYSPAKIEEKIVFYADKRIKDDEIVSLKERFDYIKNRYRNTNIEKEIEITKKIEKELIGNEKLE